MTIEVNSDRLTYFVNRYVNCLGCPARNKKCAAAKGALATKDCAQSVIEWLTKYDEEMAHAPAVVHRHSDGTMG